jgi:lipopolysaccharide export system protein LptA
MATLTCYQKLGASMSPVKKVKLCLYLLLISAPLFALPSDNSAPIRITSDHWAYNYKTGVNEYSGHAEVIQGSTHLTADKLITKSNAQHKIQEAIAYGTQQPAHYWTLSKIGGHTIHAYAKVIKYYPIESNVTLLQNVTLKQAENSFQGELIHYNSLDQTVTVPELEGSRAVLLYNPDID